MIMRFLVLLLSLVPSSEAQDVANRYVVLTVLKKSEEWTVSGADGEYRCSALAFCFDLNAGTVFHSNHSLDLTPTYIGYTSVGQHSVCNIWDCAKPNG